MRSVLPFLLATAALTCAPPATAQPAPPPTTSPFGAPGEDRILPQTSYPLGQSEGVARGLAATLRVEQAKRRLCEQFGCLVVRNDSRSYSVTGFFVKMPAMLGTDRWGPNQLDAPLRPSFALLKVKTGGADACALPVRFELKKRRTGERAAVLAEGNFCSTPGQTNLLSIRVVTPQVSVEQGS